jgi:tRNA U34 5-carboxymethylaminomethyl modifying GTPase MnmE/TrmE
LINDVLNIDFKIIEQYQNHKNLLFVFNKIDLIIDNFNYSKFLLRITNLLNTVGIKQPHIIISSTINHYGIRKLFEFIQHLD